MLHGVSLSHVTSSAKKKSRKEGNRKEKIKSRNTFEDPTDLERDQYFQDGVHSDLYLLHQPEESRNSHKEDKIQPFAGESTSAERYDVIGELSINPSNVEATITKVWENNLTLKEVSRRRRRCVCIKQCQFIVAELFLKIAILFRSFSCG